MSTILGIFTFLVGGVIALALFAFWIWMLIHAITNKGLRDTEKVIWVIVVIFLPLLGPILYFVLGRPRGAGGIS